MNLRANLKATVARCIALGMQHATSSEIRATGDATGVQPIRSIRRNISAGSATASATSMQPECATCATRTQIEEEFYVARPSECNTQLGALTAHRVAAELLAAAMRACNHHGDGESARDQMRRECLELPPHLQRDLLAHFRRTTELAGDMQ